MNRKTHGALLLAWAAGLVAACSSGAGSPPEEAGPQVPEAIEVSVENQHWNDVTVYALRAGEEYRLGNVTTNDRQTFELPSIAVGPGGEIQLLAVAIGSRDSVTTSSLFVAPGDTVKWTLTNDLSLSFVDVI